MRGNSPIGNKSYELIRDCAETMQGVTGNLWYKGT